MAVTFELPGTIEQAIRSRVLDLDRAAKEATLLELFKQGTLTHFELSQAMGIDRFETDALLKRHQVVEGSLTWDDVESDRETIAEVLGRQDGK